MGSGFVIVAEIRTKSTAEIDGDDLREVVLEESAPGLRRRFTAADHVLGDTVLADVYAEL